MPVLFCQVITATLDTLKEQLSTSRYISVKTYKCY